MIISIGGLKIPPTVHSVAEQINRDSVNQSVNGRLIVNLDPNPKWKFTLTFDEFSLSRAFQTEFYAKCLTGRTSDLFIEFVSPYSGETLFCNGRCIEIATPEILSISKRTRKPSLYGKVGAVFQQI